MLGAVCVMSRSVLRQSAVSLASLEIGASTNGHADAAALAAANTRTVTGVLTSRPTSRDIKIDGFSMGLNGVELIQARLVLVWVASPGPATRRLPKAAVPTQAFVPRVHRRLRPYIYTKVCMSVFSTIYTEPHSGVALPACISSTFRRPEPAGAGRSLSSSQQSVGAQGHAPHAQACAGRRTALLS